jgi:hypothetical protein
VKRTPTDIPKASKEVILEASKLSNPAARFLVSNYYDQQEARKRADMQLRHLGEKVENELVATLKYNADCAAVMEGQVARAEGKLPAGNLDRQACNITAKLFLSHLHAVMFWDRYGVPPPKPFAIAILGHAHEVAIPHAEMFPGFSEAYYGGPMMQAAE